MNQKLKEKITESLSSVLPVTCIVLILGITITPIPLDPLMLFLAGAAFLIIGMGFFTLGVDMAMMPIGEKVGAQLARATKLPVIVIACIIIGAMVTVAEPDLQVRFGHCYHGAYDDTCDDDDRKLRCPGQLRAYLFSNGHHGHIHSQGEESHPYNKEGCPRQKQHQRVQGNGGDGDPED